MAKLPSRRELANKLDVLESQLAIFAAGTGTGAVLARSPQARALTAAAVSPLVVPALAADVAIRRGDSIPVRAGVYTVDQLIGLAEGIEMRQREMGVTPTGQVIAPTVPVRDPRRITVKKTPNKFSKAVSKSMKALKSSKSYGKKGTLSNAKAAFKVASKASAARAAGRKMPKSGPSKIAYKAAKTVYTDEILRRKKK